ncbi:MAG: cytochrome-c oxidase [Planctomycetota bacterium]|nr:MAG: cytochrome-c oxidase [Planctomycetota bacterium]
MVSEEHHEVSYATYVIIWVGLLVLTCLTVAAAAVNLGKFNVVLALLIAMVKSSLVVLFFMHLRYERPLFKFFFLICLFTLTVIIGLTFTDTIFR